MTSFVRTMQRQVVEKDVKHLSIIWEWLKFVFPQGLQKNGGSTNLPTHGDANIFRW